MFDVLLIVVAFIAGVAIGAYFGRRAVEPKRDKRGRFVSRG